MRVGYVLFESTQAAMWAEAVLRREGIGARLVPAPRHLNAPCATALRFEDHNGLSKAVEARLTEARVPFVSVRLLEAQPVQNRKGGQDGS